jgi:hypothetical protein
MKGKTFLILLVAAGVLVALAFLRFRDQKQTADINMGQKLFADLPVNQVASVTLADAEHSVTLVKGDNVWQVEQRSGYPADFGELRDMVVKLSRLKIGRSFTASSESLTRLSLLAPSAADAKGRGTQMTLKDASGKVLADIILGQTRKTDEGGSGGQYLKKTDSDTVFLVDNSFRFLKTAPAEWLQKQILDVKADDIASVACYAGDNPQPVYTLTRPEKGKAPQMDAVPAGRKIDSAKVDQVFDALAPLTVDDVAAADENPTPPDGGARRLVYRLFDGRQIAVFPESDGKETYRLRVTAEDAAGQPAADAKAESTSGDKEKNKTSETAAAESKPDAKPPVVKTAKQMNDELRPWVFLVKKWQFDSFITQPDALLETVKKKAD